MHEPARRRWILFDAVGTLMNPVPSVGEAYWKIGRQFGSGLTVDEVVRRFHEQFRRSFSNDATADLTSSEQIELERWRQIVQFVLDDVRDAEACFAAVHRHFSQASAWTLFDDVSEVVQQLQSSGFKLAIASNFDERLHDVAQGHAALQRFDAVLTSAELGFRKPSHRFYEKLSLTLNAGPHEMLMVGDHPLNDVKSARDAGLQAVLIDREHRQGHETERISSFQQLPAWIADHQFTAES